MESSFQLMIAYDMFYYVKFTALSIKTICRALSLLSGLYMARHEAGSHEARHTSCAPCGPRAFTWQVCQPASQTSC